ncbi:hypothetical protein VP01_1851g1 [Puccinia sorghi]|uniref:Uncharacterized protein n=1 Tax=Puccinia sorghi TaxID=27349 RepID=A0A0L6VDN3_9BASI|nr:hypothetical protein VP01_1851g1 [Puccinia sorghi]
MVSCSSICSIFDRMNALLFNFLSQVYNPNFPIFWTQALFPAIGNSVCGQSRVVVGIFESPTTLEMGILGNIACTEEQRWVWICGGIFMGRLVVAASKAVLSQMATMENMHFLGSLGGQTEPYLEFAPPMALIRTQHGKYPHCRFWVNIHLIRGFKVEIPCMQVTPQRETYMGSCLNLCNSFFTKPALPLTGIHQAITTPISLTKHTQFICLQKKRCSKSKNYCGGQVNLLCRILHWVPLMCIFVNKFLLIPPSWHNATSALPIVMPTSRIRLGLDGFLLLQSCMVKAALGVYTFMKVYSTLHRGSHTFQLCYSYMISSHERGAFQCNHISHMRDCITDKKAFLDEIQYKNKVDPCSCIQNSQYKMVSSAGIFQQKFCALTSSSQKKDVNQDFDFISELFKFFLGNRLGCGPTKPMLSTHCLIKNFWPYKNPNLPNNQNLDYHISPNVNYYQYQSQNQYSPLPPANFGIGNSGSGGDFEPGGSNSNFFAQDSSGIPNFHGNPPQNPPVSRGSSIPELTWKLNQGFCLHPHYYFTNFHTNFSLSSVLPYVKMVSFSSICSTFDRMNALLFNCSRLLQQALFPAIGNSVCGQSRVVVGIFESPTTLEMGILGNIACTEEQRWVWICGGIFMGRLVVAASKAVLSQMATMENMHFLGSLGGQTEPYLEFAPPMALIRTQHGKYPHCRFWVNIHLIRGFKVEIPCMQVTPQRETYMGSCLNLCNSFFTKPALPLTGIHQAITTPISLTKHTQFICLQKKRCSKSKNYCGGQVNLLCRILHWVPLMCIFVNKFLLIPPSWHNATSALPIVMPTSRIRLGLDGFLLLQSCMVKAALGVYTFMKVYSTLHRGSHTFQLCYSYMISSHERGAFQCNHISHMRDCITDKKAFLDEIQYKNKVDPCSCIQNSQYKMVSSAGIFQQKFCALTSSSQKKDCNHISHMRDCITDKKSFLGQVIQVPILDPCSCIQNSQYKMVSSAGIIQQNLCALTSSSQKKDLNQDFDFISELFRSIIASDEENFFLEEEQTLHYGLSSQTYNIPHPQQIPSASLALPSKKSNRRSSFFSSELHDTKANQHSVHAELSLYLKEELEPEVAYTLQNGISILQFQLRVQPLSVYSLEAEGLYLSNPLSTQTLLRNSFVSRSDQLTELPPLAFFFPRKTPFPPKNNKKTQNIILRLKNKQLARSKTTRGFRVIHTYHPDHLGDTPRVQIDPSELSRLLNLLTGIHPCPRNWCNSCFSWFRKTKSCRFGTSPSEALIQSTRGPDEAPASGRSNPGTRLNHSQQSKRPSPSRIGGGLKRKCRPHRPENLMKVPCAQPCHPKKEVVSRSIRLDCVTNSIRLKKQRLEYIFSWNLGFIGVLKPL